MTNSKNAARTLKITSGRMLTNLATMRGKLVQMGAEPSVMPLVWPRMALKRSSPAWRFQELSPERI